MPSLFKKKDKLQRALSAVYKNKDREPLDENWLQSVMQDVRSQGAPPVLAKPPARRAGRVLRFAPAAAIAVLVLFLTFRLFQPAPPMEEPPTAHLAQEEVIVAQLFWIE